MASAPDPTADASISLQAALSSAVLRHAHPARQLVLGLSGGLDSSLLLAVCCQFVSQNPAYSLRAIHINHGIVAAATQWEADCQRLCKSHQVPLTVKAAKIERAAERAVSEDEARRARYAIFEDELEPQETLLLAHHLDDQLETLLLRLNRGSGVDGLAGMPLTRPLGAGRLLRPWLGFSRPELLLAARQLGLKWLDDPSNEQTHYDRNLLRKNLLPRIEERWPEYRQSWAKSLLLLGDAAELNSDLAQIDMQACRAQGSGRLRVEPLSSLTLPRLRNVLRHWLKLCSDTSPSWSLLMRLAEEVGVSPEAPASWPFDAMQVQRFRGELAILRREDVRTERVELVVGGATQQRVDLPGNGSLLFSRLQDDNAHAYEAQAAVAVNQFTVRYRRGGELVRQLGRGTRKLKKALNEARVEPWLRDRTPLLYRGDELVWVAGIEGLPVSGHAPLNRIEWLAPDLELTKS